MGRVLRALAAHDIFVEDAQGCFTNNAASLALTSDHPEHSDVFDAAMASNTAAVAAAVASTYDFTQLDTVVDVGGAETKLSDLNMLVMPGGRERSEAEFAAVFDRAGLRLRRTVRTGSAAYILEAVTA